jgi:hypothetical protein
MRRFSGIASLEDEQRRLDEKLEQSRTVLRGYEEEASRAAANRDELNKEVAALEENIEEISCGLYQPHFSFQSSEEYKIRLTTVRDRERAMVRSCTAVVCPNQLLVNGDRKQGARMLKHYTKLLLRAFNGECDAAVAEVTWGNITRMEERVQKAHRDINELGTVMQVSICPEYLSLKLDELRLAEEYEEKRYKEREEQRRIREQIREEERAQRELERAKEDAEREQEEYEKALARAREEALKTTGAQLDNLTRQIKSLEQKVEEARQIKARATARAQLTKSGFVYVISNIGSFGERVYKIGMTRRLEPMDRIFELGDASVPFPFDLHAMLYSDNAPELECALHSLVENRAVNLVNPRKEFYKNVDLGEIEEFVKKRGLSAQFIKIPEAKEYRQTLAMRESGVTTVSAA